MFTFDPQQVNQEARDEAQREASLPDELKAAYDSTKLFEYPHLLVPGADYPAVVLTVSQETATTRSGDPIEGHYRFGIKLGIILQDPETNQPLHGHVWGNVFTQRANMLKNMLEVLAPGILNGRGSQTLDPRKLTGRRCLVRIDTLPGSDDGKLFVTKYLPFTRQNPVQQAQNHAQQQLTAQPQHQGQPQPQPQPSVQGYGTVYGQQAAQAQAAPAEDDLGF